MPFHDVLGQRIAIETLRRGLSQARLHPALLFHGPDGVGKELTAFALACAIVCTSAPGEGCGKCSACHRALSSSAGESSEVRGPAGVPLHPDVMLVERGLYPKEVLGRSTDEKTDISVDQIRRVILERVSLTPHEAPQRIIIIRRAEEMSPSAANALLKTLEEPPAHTRFVLLTARPGELLPTIRSRTQPVRFAPLADEIVEEILRRDGVDTDRAREVAPLAGGSVEAGRNIADPEAAKERGAAVDALRAAAQGPLSKLLEATSAYGNGGQDRRLLHDHLTALATREATILRALVAKERATPDPAARAPITAAIEAALARHAAALEVTAALDRNANVPLALEAGWLPLVRG